MDICSIQALCLSPGLRQLLHYHYLTASKSALKCSKRQGWDQLFSPEKSPSYFIYSVNKLITNVMIFLFFLLSDAVFTNGQGIDYLFVGNIVYTVSLCILAIFEW